MENIAYIKLDEKKIKLLIVQSKKHQANMSVQYADMSMIQQNTTALLSKILPPIGNVHVVNKEKINSTRHK